MDTIQTSRPSLPSAHVRASVDQRAFLASMKHLFSSSTTFLGELLQNARRAGATAVHVTSDKAAQSIAFRDDGCGVSDFSVLVAFARSNWSEQTMLDDRPFGMGFFSTLFAAKTVIVRSRGRSIQLCIDDVVAQRDLPVIVDPLAPDQGTIVELIGVEPYWFDNIARRADLSEYLARVAQGFAIPVWLNGAPIDRKLAIDGGRSDWIDTPVGKVSLSGMPGGPLPTDLRQFHSDLCTFLQGLPIGDRLRPTLAHERIPVVHLDAARFAARMPDRAQLYDHGTAMDEIHTAVSQVICDHLAREKARLVALGDEGRQRFVIDYWSVCIHHGVAHLLNDIGLIPMAQITRPTVEVGVQDAELDFAVNAKGINIHRLPCVTREQVTSGEVRLATDWPQLDECGPIQLTMQAALLVSNFNEISTQGLHESHWVFTDVPACADLDVSWEAASAKPAFAYTSCDYPIDSLNVEIVEALSLTLRSRRSDWSHTVQIQDNWVMVPITDGRPADDESFEVKCYVAGDIGSRTSPVEIVQTFADENDNYHEDWRNDAVATFDRLLRQARGEPLDATLRHQLRNDFQLAENHVGQVALVGVATVEQSGGSWLSPQVRAVDLRMARRVLRHMKLSAKKADCEKLVAALVAALAIETAGS